MYRVFCHRTVCGKTDNIRRNQSVEQEVEVSRIKLWCDDLRPAPEGWHWAKTITEAMRTLATQDVEEISLDHDIGHQLDFGKTVACQETFEAVCWYLFALGGTKKITIHSANIEAGKKMMKILQEGLGDDWDIKHRPVTLEAK